MSRASKAYVSAYSRSRASAVTLYPTEKRSLVAAFNSAIGSATIVSARWQLSWSGVATLSDALITGKTTSVTLDAYRSGCASCRCTVTLSTGEVLNHMFIIWVGESDFTGDAIGSGSLDLTVTAP